MNLELTEHQLLDKLIKDCVDFNDEKRLSLICYVLKNQRPYTKFKFKENKIYWSYEYHGDSYFSIDIHGNVIYHIRNCGCCGQRKETDIDTGNLFIKGIVVFEKPNLNFEE